MHRITTTIAVAEKAGKTGKAPARSTIHDEIGTLRLVLKTGIRHGWLAHLPDLSPPYKTSGKIVHRPWFSPAEYKQLYTATRAYAKDPAQPQYQWNADQLHDYVLFMGNTGMRPDEAGNLQHRDVTVVTDPAPVRKSWRLRCAASVASASARAPPAPCGLTNACFTGQSRSAGCRPGTGASKIQTRSCPMNCRNQPTRCSPAAT